MENRAWNNRTSSLASGRGFFYRGWMDVWRSGPLRRGPFDHAHYLPVARLRERRRTKSGQPRSGHQTAEDAEGRRERPALIVLCAPLRPLRLILRGLI